MQKIIEDAAKAMGKNPLDVQAEIDSVKNAYALDPDTIDQPVEDTTGGLAATGEGLSKREAQLLLVEEMNGLIQQSNRRRLNRFQVEEKHWIEFGGIPPYPAIIAPGFSGRRHLSQAVFMARQRGGYKQLLINAGFK